jgi:hypothetical protein
VFIFNSRIVNVGREFMKHCGMGKPLHRTKAISRSHNTLPKLPLTEFLSLAMEGDKLKRRKKKYQVPLVVAEVRLLV